MIKEHKIKHHSNWK